MAQTERSIIYGPGTTDGETIGGTTNYLLVPDSVEWGVSYKEFWVEGLVIVQEQLKADFDTADANLRAAWTKPKQRLRVITDTQTLDFNPADYSGTQARADLQKLADDETGRLRIYRFRVVTQTPANLSGDAGRFAARVRTSYTGARQRTVQITGSYTAIDPNGALATYQAAIYSALSGTGATVGGFAGTQLTAINAAAVWELINEDHDADDEDTEIGFTVVFRELVADQSGAGRDHVDLVDDRLTVSRRRVGGESSLELGGAYPLVTVEVGYSCEYKGSENLSTAYSTVVRPHLLEQVSELFGLAGWAVVGDVPSLDPTTSRIACTLTLLARDGGSLIEADVVTSVSMRDPVAIAETWSDGPLDAYVLSAPGREVMTIVTSRRDLGSKGGPAPGPGRGWTRLDSEEIYARKRLGLAVTGATLEIWATTWREVYRRVTEPAGGVATATTTPGGSGGDNRPPPSSPSSAGGTRETESAGESGGSATSSSSSGAAAAGGNRPTGFLVDTPVGDPEMDFLR